MNKKNFYKRLINYLNNSKKKGFIGEDRKVDEVHGFQLIFSDLDTYLRNFLNEEQASMFLNNINSLGFLDHNMGVKLKELLDDNDHDFYIKSIHDSQIESIFTEGIRCLGKSASLPTTNPLSINQVNLNNTINKVDNFPTFIASIKGNNGFSQGGIMINGTLVLKIPKGTTKDNLLYYNRESQTFNIKSEYIIGFIPVDSDNRVGEWILINDKNKKNLK